jgi:hypothetical protein
VLLLGLKAMFMQLPSLDLPGDPPAFLFDVDARADAVFNALWLHHVPALRNGEMPLVKKQTHPAPARIQ